ncbi:GNAT family N-acetyltransferase [Streptomyces alkaliphilus]|uniref:GNAT family N-acetyltransferase n=1 Tax=Streptomyces alkaliphilus TaxID=1472722 RepID=UPI001180A549|nr:GNAT family N-acetyltransferase [Streptomyces alkaliphilus]MQS06280.1 GNAT family N-acetyltransferase [Streptomyces alkaliphilus]
MGEVFLRRLSRWQAEDQRAALADLHEDAYRDQPGAVLRDREDFLQRFADHLQQPEFDMVIASDPALVGCAYGFRIDRHGSWLDRFSTVPHELEELTELAMSRQLFLVAELMVRPEHRRQGVGGRLLDQLLSRVSAPVAVVLLEPGDAVGRATFEMWGWEKTGRMLPRGNPQQPGPLEAWTRRPGR